MNLSQPQNLDFNEISLLHSQQLGQIYMSRQIPQFYQDRLNMSMQTILRKERMRSTLSAEPLGHFLYGEKYYKDLKGHLEKGPTLDYTPNIYNKSRTHLMIDSAKYLPLMFNYNEHHSDEDLHLDHKNIYIFLNSPHQRPGAVHFDMFITYIQLMGTQQHKKLYLQKAINCQISGCYAQTQIGHGSDIQNLQTTATYDQTTREWIIDSPTTSSAKYWPGQIGFFANHALVFAQTYIKGKKYGVNPFLVAIKDKEERWLPGIQGGDIGPKLGFHAKNNGYIYFRNVRIPKDDLLTKYVEMSDSGEFKRVGDARISYGTMMYVRQGISTEIPKLYAAVIIMATRYSFFRKQGLNEKKEEKCILEYQTQQEKVIPRIAEYYALTVAGTKIRSVNQRNRELIQHSDFSLLQETHSILAFSKCLFTQLGQDGMEMLRRSMGGHGTSYYSGVPQIMNEFAANNTLEGENTVMYIQTARYVLKSVLGYKLKGKALPESLNYVSRFQELENLKFNGNNPWTINELADVLVKTLSHLLNIIGMRMANKQEGETDGMIINGVLGIRIQQLAQLHGVNFMVIEFIRAIEREKKQEIKPLMVDLCKLFAIGQIQRLAEPIIQAGFICPLKWGLLNWDKQASIKAIRPHTAVLLDSFAIPDKYLRSEVVRGHPYENFLNRARESDINTSVTQSAIEVGKIKDILAAKPRL